MPLRLLRWSILRTVRRWSSSIHWELVLLIGAFLLMVPSPYLPEGALGWFLESQAPSPSISYERALADAAIKKPDFQVKDLVTFDATATEITVGTFASLHKRRPIGPQQLTGPMWVFLPEELASKCSVESDADLAVRQILGLPPKYDQRTIYALKVARSDVFRPCLSGGDLSLNVCDFRGPTFPDTNESYQRLAGRDRVEVWKKAYGELWFLVDHLSRTHSTGFPDRYANPGDYPYDAYPFTGMGWTYDWRPFQKSHVGVSEFVIRAGATITVLSWASPKEFCATGKKS